MKRTFAIVALLLGASACAAKPLADHPPVRGTIAGMVLIGPTCPFERLDGTSCPPTPLKARVEVVDGSGRLVASVESGDDGRFSLTVPPGSYTVRIGGLGIPRLSKPVSVAVAAGKTTTVGLMVDSGIR